MAFSDSAEELKHLQRCMRDLVSVLALPAVWGGQEPRQIVTTFHDGLMATLNLDFLYTRVKIETDGEPIEILRTAPLYAATQTADKIRHALNERFGDDPRKWPAEVPNRLDGTEASLLSMRLGHEGEIGIVVAGSERADFPTQSERLLLGVAANQVTVGLQQARLLSEQKRIADELERRVAGRTASLAAANEELRTEIAERRIVEGRLHESEDLLKASESKLRQVIDTIPSLSWCNLPDGPNEFLSKGWHDYTGLSPEEAYGWGWTAAFHPEDLPPLMKRWKELLISGEPGQIEARLRRHDGVYRWFLIQVAPLRDETGKIVRWYGTSTDIEDRKRAEDAVLANERNLGLIISTMPVLAWSAQADGNVDFFNQRWLDYTGLSLTDARDWGWAKVFHPDDLGIVNEYWQSRIASGEPGEIEARLRRFDGSYRWFLFRANPLRNESGAVIKWYGTNTDIDDRKRAEDELKRSEARYRVVIETASDAVVSIDESGAIILANPATKRIFGYNPEEIIGKPLTFLMPGAMRKLHETGFNRYLETGTRHLNWQGTEVTALRANGEEFPAEVSFGEMTAEQRKVFTGFIRDISEKKRSEEELRNSQAELARIMRVMTIGQLTASIAHEVNQPLSGIVTNAGTCLRMLDNDPPNIEGARETARRTIRDGNRASEVITRLRALFKRKEIAAESIDLNDAAREVIALSWSELQSNRIVVRHDFADDLPAVKGDRTQLQQVILNLVHNASDAMRDIEDRPRQLVIKTESVDRKNVQLTVQDTGVGFTPDAADRLFESFYTTKDDGMGIGLSVSRSIIEAHRGRLWASPNDGAGSSFAFSIPYDCSTEST
jgi:PAS domain S-box-containing protein